ncbi:UNVERIFIED_CONTAM: hypothetical protein Sindi_1290300 [Sesamum indicum]
MLIYLAVRAKRASNFEMGFLARDIKKSPPTRPCEKEQRPELLEATDAPGGSWLNHCCAALAEVVIKTRHDPVCVLVQELVYHDNVCEGDTLRFFPWNSHTGDVLEAFLKTFQMSSPLLGDLWWICWREPLHPNRRGPYRSNAFSCGSSSFLLEGCPLPTRGQDEQGLVSLSAIEYMNVIEI